MISPIREVKDLLKILAGDQWWPRTSGGHLRLAQALTYLLRHRLGNFVKGNKRNPHKKDGKILCLGGLVGCFGFNGLLRQYFSLYRAVSQREGERGEKG